MAQAAALELPASPAVSTGGEATEAAATEHRNVLPAAHIPEDQNGLPAEGTPEDRNVVLAAGSRATVPGRLVTTGTAIATAPIAADNSSSRLGLSYS